jgi:hypothetical protein
LYSEQLQLHEKIICFSAGTSISSQFLVRLSQGGPLSSPTLRNVAVINAAKQTRVDSETSKKREELQRRIEETRRKLQSVGFKLVCLSV